MDKQKLTKAQQEIKKEIEWYQTGKEVSKIMRRLGRQGFIFSGHGAGFGGEDFSLIKHLGRQSPKRKLKAYVNISDRGKFPKCSGEVYNDVLGYDSNLVSIKEMNPVKFFPLLNKTLKQFAKIA